MLLRICHNPGLPLSYRRCSHALVCRKEVQRAYFRILSQHLIESVQDGCASVTASTETLTGDTFDVSNTGREFVTKEVATKLFEPMLRQGPPVGLRFSDCMHPGLFYFQLSLRYNNFVGARVL
jgi:hypothetical protein